VAEISSELRSTETSELPSEQSRQLRLRINEGSAVEGTRPVPFTQQLILLRFFYPRHLIPSRPQPLIFSFKCSIFNIHYQKNLLLPFAAACGSLRQFAAYILILI
jgi:hypothetical protein